MAAGNARSLREFEVVNAADAHRANFYALSRTEQEAAILKMIDAGHSEDIAAAASGYSVEMIRTIVGARAMTAGNYFRSEIIE